MKKIPLTQAMIDKFVEAEKLRREAWELIWTTYPEFTLLYEYQHNILCENIGVNNKVKKYLLVPDSIDLEFKKNLLQKNLLYGLNKINRCKERLSKIFADFWEFKE